jgi:hypothetical protein
MGIKNWLLGIYGAPPTADPMDMSGTQNELSNFALAMSIPDMDDTTPLGSCAEIGVFSTPFDLSSFGSGGFDI